MNLCSIVFIYFLLLLEVRSCSPRPLFGWFVQIVWSFVQLFWFSHSKCTQNALYNRLHKQKSILFLIKAVVYLVCECVVQKFYFLWSHLDGPPRVLEFINFFWIYFKLLHKTIHDP